MLEIFVDGDACPVKAEVERVALRHGLNVTIVSNGGLRPSANPLLRPVAAAVGYTVERWADESAARHWFHACAAGIRPHLGHAPS